MSRGDDGDTTTKERHNDRMSCTAAPSPRGVLARALRTARPVTRAVTAQSVLVMAHSGCRLECRSSSPDRPDSRLAPKPINQSNGLDLLCLLGPRLLSFSGLCFPEVFRNLVRLVIRHLLAVGHPLFCAVRLTRFRFIRLPASSVLSSLLLHPRWRSF